MRPRVVAVRCHRWAESTRLLPLSRPAAMAEPPPRGPLFTFGVIADVQYADLDDGYNFPRTRRRFYRSSLDLLGNALLSWSTAAVRPSFILQLGDIIDGFNRPAGASERALDAVLTRFGSGSAVTHHVWGNHEFYNFSRSWLLESKLNSAALGCQQGAGGQVHAYRFSPHPGFTFVVLDAYDVALLGRDESSQEYQEALTLLRQHNNNQDLNTPPGTRQLHHLCLWNRFQTVIFGCAHIRDYTVINIIYISKYMYVVY